MLLERFSDADRGCTLWFMVEFGSNVAAAARGDAGAVERFAKAVWPLFELGPLQAALAEGPPIVTGWGSAGFGGRKGPRWLRECAGGHIVVALGDAALLARALPAILVLGPGKGIQPLPAGQEAGPRVGSSQGPSGNATSCARLRGIVRVERA